MSWLLARNLTKTFLLVGQVAVDGKRRRSAAPEDIQ